MSELVRTFLAGLGGQNAIQVKDSTILDLPVESVSFPTAEEQDSAIFLVIRTPDGPMHLRLEEQAKTNWMDTLSRNVRYGGSRHEHVFQYGECPFRKLELVRSLSARGPQPR